MSNSESIPAKETQQILVAIGLSIATKTCPTVKVSNVHSACRFIQSRFDGVDWDWADDGHDDATIFGDDRRIPICDDDEGNEAHFTIRLVGPKRGRFVAKFRSIAGVILSDDSYTGPIEEAVQAAAEDAHRYGWVLVSVESINA